MAEPDPHDPQEPHRGPAPSNAAAWWVAGLVALVAIVAVAYVARPPAQPTDQQVATAAEQGRLQGYVEGSQATQAQSAQAQQSAAAQQSLADQAAQQRADAQRSRNAPTSADQYGRDAPAPPSSGSDTGSGG